jgi:hypothetical protein
LYAREEADTEEALRYGLLVLLPLVAILAAAWGYHWLGLRARAWQQSVYWLRLSDNGQRPRFWLIVFDPKAGTQRWRVRR